LRSSERRVGVGDATRECEVSGVLQARLGPSCAGPFVFAAAETDSSLFERGFTLYSVNRIKLAPKIDKRLIAGGEQLRGHVKSSEFGFSKCHGGNALSRVHSATNLLRDG